MRGFFVMKPLASFRYLFLFEKKGDLVFISHLDVLRLLSRAARRAELPLRLSEGFSPRFKIKLKRALKLGVASNDEEGEILLTEKLEPSVVRRRWNSALPDGLQIRDVQFLSAS